MQIQKRILNMILRIEMILLHFFKVRSNRVTFISLESNKLEMDFKLLYDELSQNSNIEVKLCLFKYNKSLIGQFKYLLNCLKQLYFVKTSRVILLDYNNYVVSTFKKDETIVIQIWHAVGAIKKFGNLIQRSYQAQNYDYVLATSQIWNKIYSDAFLVTEEHVLNFGFPRLDHLFDQNYIQDSILKLKSKYPQLVNKKVILYAPTFRGDIYKGFETVPFDAKQLLSLLGEEYVVIYKFHPLLGDINLENNDKIVNMNNEDTHQLLCLCDYLVTDYSSIVFDYLILEKPLLFYVPDRDRYDNQRGMVIPLESLSNDICLQVKELSDSIKWNRQSKDDMKILKDKFFDYQDGQSTKRVSEFIINLIERRR